MINELAQMAQLVGEGRGVVGQISLARAIRQNKRSCLFRFLLYEKLNFPNCGNDFISEIFFFFN